MACLWLACGRKIQRKVHCINTQGRQMLRWGPLINTQCPNAEAGGRPFHFICQQQSYPLSPWHGSQNWVHIILDESIIRCIRCPMYYVLLPYSPLVIRMRGCLTILLQFVYKYLWMLDQFFFYCSLLFYLVIFIFYF